MRVELPLGAGIGFAVVLVAAVLLLGRDPALVERLGRYGINVSGGTGGATSLRAPLARADRVSATVAGTSIAETRRRVWAMAGQTLALDYDVSVEQGRLVLAVGPTGPGALDLWREGLEASRRDRATLRLPRTGNYDVVIRRVAFGGSYDVGWSVK